ncbi:MULTISPECIES: helix-turn-helix domain-containing protein [Bacillus cereus group]|uniref:helix-turn-helix domain-containing protein n=1 Tax=Bacillus cereus group TaxID=86661 RepID=UPI000BF835C6|nr:MULTISPECIES: helix-turn-helix transcriptional regulator [Bacillus cereus group]MBG9716628.1 transcriptional regulator [Bacillus cereus]MED2874030.1 helix-turn-helix transcriptional regulator [Bacillus thuringiensis]MED3480105.1 helix-turn-helix transcriptional regulator [Bacillus thuringiensis]MED3635102.1 helix-turn-helix transcriptional regulator [Bacillus thuringiensis]PEZ32014.1 transcriptional regulator [Bacillus thuringiensis]
MTKLNIEKVKTLREQHGYSQNFVAKHIGYTHKGAYSLLESGNRQPSISKLGLLAKLYEIKVDELLIG